MLTKNAEDMTFQEMTEKVMNTNEFVIADPKIERFCLRPGAKHWEQFEKVGFTVNDGDILREQLKSAFLYEDRVEVKSGSIKGDISFNIYTELGITSKSRFCTGWQIDRGTDIARFITAFEKKRGG